MAGIEMNANFQTIFTRNPSLLNFDLAIKVGTLHGSCLSYCLTVSKALHIQFQAIDTMKHP